MNFLLLNNVFGNNFINVNPANKPTSSMVEVICVGLSNKPFSLKFGKH